MNSPTLLARNVWRRVRRQRCWSGACLCAPTGVADSQAMHATIKGAISGTDRIWLGHGGEAGVRAGVDVG